MLPDHAGRSRIVHHHRARAFRDAPQHRVIEIAPIEGGTSAGAPQLFGQRAMPFAVVVDELVDVCGAVERAQKEMLQHGIVQHDYAGVRQRPAVDLPMQLIVTQMIERDVGAARAGFHGTIAAQSR